MPSGLYYSHADDLGARVVGHKSRFYIDNSTALEMMQRLNFRCDPIPYLGMFGKWATVPDEKIKDFTWKTSVDVGFGYLVRLHFCERGLLMAENRNSIFSVFINDMTAEINVDIGKERSVISGIHLYRDYMVMVKGHKEVGRRDLTISLQSKDELVSELFKGLEILKLSNHDNSLANPNPSPPGRSSKSITVLNLLSFFGFGNAIATGAVIVISLVNIITYKLRKIWEANPTDCGYEPSALTGKLCRPFKFTEIQSATENFNEALVIGKGGFVLCERPALDRRVKEDKQSLIIWAQDCISKGDIDQLVAPSLRAQISPESLMTFLEVAKRCLHDEPNKRPTMAQVVLQLESALEQQESSKSSAPEITSSDSVVPCAGETLHSISSEIEEMSPVDKQNMPLSLTERSKMVQNAEPSGRGAQVYKRNINAYKLPRFWPWITLWKRANLTKKNHLSVPEYFGEEVESHRFDLATIAAATKFFSLPNKIGEGGFGNVYKGLLSTGQEVAVKRLSSNSYQAYNVLKNENKSLDAHLFGGKRYELGWTIRFKIAITRTLERIVETYGYMSPQYAMKDIFSVKSDVFGFGVLLLEIVSGRRRIYCAFPDLIECAWKTWNEGKALEFLDNSMKDEFPVDEALRCIQTGLLCVQKGRDDRPTMQSVFEMLEGEDRSLPQPLQPAYVEKYPSLKTSTHIDATNEVTVPKLECR
ncbi:unnamed protein product [Fraxinus pennsylvanica]|uniref:Tyrosine-protein kinase catalytic domain-containing protein n=1 Tax=Fraxinus pennsylvanica TaxID=56036 RepID=A0AAD1ZLT2_9LAMI|nr:unnamed protein product [Fraxinus pennsylvanica]